MAVTTPQTQETAYDPSGQSELSGKTTELQQSGQDLTPEFGHQRIFMDWKSYKDNSDRSRYLDRVWKTLPDYVRYDEAASRGFVGLKWALVNEDTPGNMTAFLNYLRDLKIRHVSGQRHYNLPPKEIETLVMMHYKVSLDDIQPGPSVETDRSERCPSPASGSVEPDPEAQEQTSPLRGKAVKDFLNMWNQTTPETLHLMVSYFRDRTHIGPRAIKVDEEKLSIATENALAYSYRSCEHMLKLLQSLRDVEQKVTGDTYQYWNLTDKELEVLVKDWSTSLRFLMAKSPWTDLPSRSGRPV